MNKELIIEMAKQSDLGFLFNENWLMHEEIERFARLVAEHEREQCAKVCDELETNSDAEFYGHEFSKAIRERGKK